MSFWMHLTIVMQRISGRNIRSYSSMNKVLSNKESMEEESSNNLSIECSNLLLAQSMGCSMKHNKTKYSLIKIVQ